jgi:preprotein translocase subunit SecG
LKYKWSLLAKYNYEDDTPVKNNASTTFNGNNSFAPIETEVTAPANSSFYDVVSKTRVAIIILFIILVLICISILFYYKKKQKDKKSNSNETEKNLE